MRERGYDHRQELPSRADWAAGVDVFCVRLLEGNAPAAVRMGAAHTMTAAIWSWLRRTVQTSHDLTKPSAQQAALASLGPAVLAVLNACSMISADARFGLRQQPLGVSVGVGSP